MENKQAPVELAEEQLDHVTGGRATVLQHGPGADIALPSHASSTATDGGIGKANSHAGENPAFLFQP
jgi:hypothetical protein